MTRKTTLSIWHVLSFFVVLAFMCSCSSNYVNVIPRNVKVVVAVKPQQLAEGSELVNSLMKLLELEGTDDCGLNLNNEIYVFEAADGTLGIVAEVASESKLEDFFVHLREKRIATELDDYKGFKFSVVNNSFVVGISSNAVLIMGPALSTEHQALKRRMAKCLMADKEEGMEGTEMFKRLSAIDGCIAIVAQLKALPENLFAPFAMTMPSKVDFAKCYVSASVGKRGTALLMEGELFAFDSTTNDSIQAMRNKYRPISDTYLNTIPASNLLTLVCSMKGTELLDMMRSSNEIRTLLFGMNTSMDIDKMLKSIDGQIIVGYDEGNDESNFSLMAEISNADWIQDIGYWKRSSPQGTMIDNIDSTNFRICGGATNVYFGVNGNGKVMYITSDEEVAKDCIKPVKECIDDELKSMATGKLIAIFLNLGSFANSIGGNEMFNAVNAFIGGIDTLVIIEK
ncbi:MAG: DUF4836 family protein [Prevotella sp.]